MKPASIVIHKVVVNHGLSYDTTHFAPYNVGSTTVVLDAMTTINSGTYLVTEKSDANYTMTYSGDCNASGRVVATPGSAKSCTITDEEIPTKLTVHVVVVNHGLSFNADHFAPYAIDGGTLNLDTGLTVKSGAHIVTETQDQNYTQKFSGACEASGIVTLKTGDQVICTVTNEEKTGISLDTAAQSGASCAPTSTACSVDINIARSNEVVFVFARDGSGDLLTNGMIGSSSLRFINRRYDSSLGGTSYLYYFVNPPIGTSTISFDVGAYSFVAVHAVAYSGVDLSMPYESQQGMSCTRTPCTLTISTTHDGDWLLGAGNDDNSPNSGAGFTLRTAGTNSIMEDTRTSVSAGTHDVTIADSSAAHFVLFALGIVPK